MNYISKISKEDLFQILKETVSTGLGDLLEITMREGPSSNKSITLFATYETGTEEFFLTDYSITPITFFHNRDCFVNQNQYIYQLYQLFGENYLNEYINQKFQLDKKQLRIKQAISDYEKALGLAQQERQNLKECTNIWNKEVYTQELSK